MNSKLIARMTLIAVSFSALSSSPGQSWTKTSAPIPNLKWTSLALSANGSQMVATANTSTYPGDGPIYTSADSEGSWVSNSLVPRVWLSVASSADGTRLLATSVGRVYISTNSGTTWEASSLRGSYYYFGVASSADGVHLAVGAPNAIFVSTNSGDTWLTNSVPNAWSAGIALACSADGSKLIAGGFEGWIYTSLDGGSIWNSNKLVARGSMFVASSAQGNILVAAAGGYNIAPGPIFISTNSGAAWRTSSAPNLMWVAVAASADGQRLLAAAVPPDYRSANMLFTSSDGGLTWCSNTVPYANWSCVASSADGNTLVAGSFYDGIWTWQRTPDPSLNMVHSGDSLTLSWTVPSTAFRLQQTLSLSDRWTGVTNTPVLNFSNLLHQVVLPAAAASGFYRLISTDAPE